jgi:hypothetical protein
MALATGMSIHIQPQSPVPPLLKPTSCHGPAILDLRASIQPRRLSDAKPLTTAEAPCEVTYSVDSVKIEDTKTSRSGEVRCQEIPADIDLKPTSDLEQKTHILDFPQEIQQNILDHLVGNLGSTSSKVSGNGTRNWNHAMRHPRAKEHTNLALVTPSWTRLIQERLYRHSKLNNITKSGNPC